MIKTLNPYSTAKTAEIMSRYRPIAPKPEAPTDPSRSESPSISQKIRQSPYLRNLWPHLQARPTRTRKRGRSAISLPSLKRPRTHILGFASPFGFPQLPTPHEAPEQPATPPGLVTLPLLPCPIPAAPEVVKTCGEEKVIDLNSLAEIPEEKDLLQQLQAPPTTGSSINNVIAPQPIRPVGSSISVGSINEDPSLTPAVQKKPEEVEEEVESEALPAVISDSNNKVRMANSAYKEMVGQPECSWLDSMVASSSKRISGEVMLHLSDSSVPVSSSNGFSCWVRIEWGSEGKKSSINAFCDVIRLSCESKNYLFTWRFHTHTREASQSSCNKKPQKVEKVELEALPAVISNNKVRMANLAYKEMVVQPECSWLDSMVTSSSKRISG
ncbi:hypothetical protein FH972_013768 [Carpinus fangiana]|uniref:DUF7950 domain-containing protein n=1 Tax=Carpinus fangiana TaxID=176857 RepID=A0A5N6R7Z9_9ROSI|nr:hypothetical protein FH972_013768 [Carpinus fangiana]